MTPACVGLSICPPPPPDAEGNPACYYADGWAASVSGSAIDVYYFHEPRNGSKPDDVTAEIRMKDGTVEARPRRGGLNRVRSQGVRNLL
jgi:hypothetical protein